MAQIRVYNINPTSFTVRLAELQTDVAYTRRLDWTAVNLTEGYSVFSDRYVYIKGGASAGGAYTFRDVEPSCTYRISCEVWDDDSGNWLAFLESETFRTPAEKPSVELWDWEIGTGSDKDRAYQALANHGHGRDFSYVVWNKLVEKVREAYRAKWNGGTYGEYESALDDAKMSYSGQEFLADMFNNVRAVIGSELKTFAENDNSIYDHFIETGQTTWNMKRGEIIKGEYILDLVKKLNKGISTL